MHCPPIFSPIAPAIYVSNSAAAVNHPTEDIIGQQVSESSSTASSSVYGSRTTIYDDNLDENEFSRGIPEVDGDGTSDMVNDSPPTWPFLQPGYKVIYEYKREVKDNSILSN